MAAVRRASCREQLSQLQASYQSVRLALEQLTPAVPQPELKLRAKRKVQQQQRPPQLVVPPETANSQRVKLQLRANRRPGLDRVKRPVKLPGSRQARPQFDLRPSFCRYWPNRVRYALFRAALADRKHNLAARSGERPISGSY
jgi:hypothetical protein